jgi:hypothetical protein
VRYDTLRDMIDHISGTDGKDAFAILAEHPDAPFPTDEGYSYLKCGAPIEVVKSRDVNGMVLCSDLAGCGCKPRTMVLLPLTLKVLY